MGPNTLFSPSKMAEAISGVDQLPTFLPTTSLVLHPTTTICPFRSRAASASSFATATYKACAHPVAVEEIKADAGLDIGGTLIGMHLKKVAVPVRLAQDHIGDAILLAARTRPKFIGGERAHYDEALKDGYPEF